MAGGGAKPGERRGGRKKGTPNKLSLRQAREMERALQEAKEAGKPIAKDVLDNLMAVFMMIAQHYAPSPNSRPPDDRDLDAVARWEKRLKNFERWALHAKDAASDLAPYQSPTFRAIAIAPIREPEDDDDDDVITTVEQLREHLLMRGVPPDQLARAMLAPQIEHDPDEGKK